MTKDFQMWLHYHNYLKSHKINYARYLTSKHWQRTSLKFLNHKKGRKICEACHSKHKINLHHKTYIHMGREQMRELCYLCQICHEKVHKIYKRKLKTQSLKEVTDSFISASFVKRMFKALLILD